MADTSTQVSCASAVTLDERSSPASLRFTGRLDVDGSACVWRQAFKLANKLSPKPFTLDVTDIEVLDGSGAALLVWLSKVPVENGGVEIKGLRPEHASLVNLYETAYTKESAAARQKASLPEEIGRGACEIWADIKDLITFIGEFAAAAAYYATRPHRFRMRDFLRVAEDTGANAFPIVALIGFLMGVITAFQSAMPLRQYGAEIFVANMLGLSMLRELSALVTAILMAGRTGSSFAAEIGTMAVDEELDALTTMGLDPVRFLVLTRVSAAVVVSPLLIMFFSVSALFGGGLVMAGLGFPWVTYINQMLSAVALGDMLSGLFKGMVFAFLVTAIGCQRGLTARGGPSAVGRVTTSAVVSGIILIAIADGIFAVTFYLLGI